MAQGLSPSQVQKLKQAYESGQMPDPVKRVFEEEYPQLARPGGQAGTTAAVPSRAPAPSGGPTPAQPSPLERTVGVQPGGLEPPLEPSGILAPITSIVGDLASEARQRFQMRPREPITGLQAGAEAVGGIAGGIGGTALRGSAGGGLGAGAGTFLGGVLTGRNPFDALMDAMEQGGMEYGSAKMGGAIAGRFAPHLSPAGQQGIESPTVMGPAGTARETIEAGIAKRPMAQRATGAGFGGRTEAERGQGVQRTMQQEYSQVQRMAGQAYEEVRKAVGDFDVQEVYNLAERGNIPMPSFGISTLKSVTRGAPPTQSTIISADDALQLKHLLNKQAEGYAKQGDAFKAREVGQISEALKRALQRQADAAGVGDKLKDADRFYATEIGDRFLNETVQNIMQTSGKRIVDMMSPERVGPTIRGGTVQDAEAVIKAMRRLTTQYPDALPDFRAGVVEGILDQSTNPRNGVISPEQLTNLVNRRIAPETLDTLVGKDVATALREFALNYAKGTTQIAVGSQIGGMAAAGATAAGLSPAAAIGTGIEVANELGFLGRQISRFPGMSRRLIGAILRGDEEAAKKITGLKTARIVTTQALPQTIGLLNIPERMGLRVPSLGWRDEGETP